MDEYKRRRRRSRAVMSMFLDSLGGSIDNVDVATFESDGGDLKALIVGIEPVQSGTGDPSPDNIRPITGHSSVNVIVSPTLNPLDGMITNIPLGTTVYCGTLDVVTGVLTVTHILETPTAVTGVLSNPARAYFRVNQTLTKEDTNYSACSALKTKYSSMTQSDEFCFTQVGGAIQFYFMRIDDTCTVASDYNTFLQNNSPQFLLQLATPQTIQLTGQQIATFLGTNNVWCDSGKIIHLEY